MIPTQAAEPLGLDVREVWALPELLEQARSGDEVWRVVLRTGGRYEVSNLGAVRSWVRPASTSLRDAPRLLVASPTHSGYLLVQIFIDGKRHMRPVHQLVCESFIGPRPGSSKEWETGHQNDDKTNNRLDNLKWCRRAVNIADCKRNGRLPLRECREAEGVRHYRCTKCDTWKPEADFGRITGKANRSACGVLPACRACSTADRKKYKRSRRQAA